MGMRERVQAHACVHDDVFFVFFFIVTVLSSASWRQVSLLLPATCSNTGAIRRSLSDETKQFSLKRHLAKAGGLEMM